MIFLKLLRSYETTKVRVLLRQITRPYSAKDKWDNGNVSKFTEQEEEFVLDQLNNCMETPLSIKISKKKLKTIQKFIEENNSFTRIEQLYELQGLEPEVADQMCKKIIKSSMNGSNAKTRINSNFLTPAISPTRKEKIKTMVGIGVGSSCVCWTKLECIENRISNWHMVEFPPAQEMKSILNVYDYVINLIDEVPPGDIYVMENNNWSNLSPQMSLRNHVRDAQITAILTTLLNASKKTNSTFENNNVFFMRAMLASRLFCKLIGNERVSSQQLVQKMFDGEFPEFCTRFEICSILKNYYFSLLKPLREDLCQSLLLTLACRELLLNNKSMKVKTVTD